MAVSFYILAGYIKPSQRSNEAAVKYFLLGAFSLGILLYGMSLMYGLSGTTNGLVRGTADFNAPRGARRYGSSSSARKTFLITISKVAASRSLSSA